jgi:metal-responsive CopG/Arc/MetJ family transcriptional regulator
MTAAKVAITLDSELLKQLDLLVQEQVFPNRSQAIQVAVRDKLKQLKRERLATEAAKLNPQEEQALAEEGIEDDLAAWPTY